MKIATFVAVVGSVIALSGVARAAETEVQKPQRPEKPGFTSLVARGADDVQQEVQKPQRPEKPGRLA